MCQGVVTLLLSLISIAASQTTYLGVPVSSVIWNAIQDASVAEIADLAGYERDCGIIVSTTTVGTGAGQSLTPQILSNQIMPTSTLGTFLPLYVDHAQDAHSACYRLWHCVAVQLFTISGSSSMRAAFFGSDALRLADNDATTGALLVKETISSFGTWVSTYKLNRTAGYSCNNPGDSVVDAQFLYNTYLGNPTRNERLFAAGVMPRPSAFGLPPSGASDFDVAVVATQLVIAYQTSWHRFRVWPSSKCALTPLLRDPATVCAKNRCPLATVCPFDYRTQSIAWGTCFPSLTDSPAEVVLYGDALSFNVKSGVITFEGLSPDAPVITRSAFETADFGRIESMLPCGATYGRGVCSHYTPSVGVTASPVCACGASGVSGDYGCQFNFTACIDPVSRSTCNSHGTCTFSRNSIVWSVPNLADPESGAVSCACASPWTGKYCLQSRCAFNDTGRIVDCHSEGTGTCVQRDGVWGCLCNPMNYGPGCKLVDTELSDLEVNQLQSKYVATASIGSLYGVYHCYIRLSQVESPNPDLTSEWVSCSGRGSCVVHNNPLQPSPMCVCEPGWTGMRCEYEMCDHTSTCGPFGRCTFHVTSSGRAQSACTCIMHESDGTTPLALQSERLDLPNEPLLRCDISRCIHGVLIQTNTLSPEDFVSTPLGRCACSDAFVGSSSQIIQNGTMRNATVAGINFALNWPLHPFIPTLVESNGSLRTGYKPFAYVPDLSISNEGVLCEVPSCPRFLQPWSGSPVPGLFQCGTDAVSAKAVCVTCASSPTTGLCAFTTGFGGYCDCEGTKYKLQTGTDYYSLRLSSRWVTDPNEENPMCIPYCANGGSWSVSSQSCICGNTGFGGPTCKEPLCPNGVWSKEAVGDGRCASCNQGWDIFSACTTCAEGYTGSDCTICSVGFFRDTATGRCINCNVAASQLCVFPGSSVAQCTPSGPVCVCNPGYTRPDLGCSRCSDGYTWFRDPVTRAMSCVSCARAGNCHARSIAAVCSNVTSPVCLCPANGMDPTCSFCLADTTLNPQGTACVSCAQQLQCHLPGVATKSSTCNAAQPWRSVCVCDYENGYTGTRCELCRVGWTRALDGVSCKPCDKASSTERCGYWGTLDCSDPETPQCICTNGMGGPSCSACIHCGPGGSCTLDTSPDSTWCTCLEGYTKPSSIGLTTAEQLALPCSQCDRSGWIADPSSGICIPVAQACGTDRGVNVLATTAANNGTCICHNGFVGSACESCAWGRAGPNCLPCLPAALPETRNDGVVCEWDSVTLTARWACPPGRFGAACGQCSTGYANNTRSQCVVCDVDCGPGGVCGFDNNDNTVCLCQSRFQHTDQGNETSPCSTCSTKSSPVTCSQCPPCAHGRTCEEPTAESAPLGVCKCLPGTRKLSGVPDGPSIACFHESRATALEAAVGDNPHLLLALSTATELPDSPPDFVSGILPTTGAPTAVPFLVASFVTLFLSVLLSAFITHFLKRYQ